MERESTQTVLGLDGCRGGWCTVALDVTGGRITARPPEIISFADTLASDAAVIAIDIPIGLLDVPGPRACDTEARHLLGPRRGPSVFPAPSREALGSYGAPDGYRKACDVNEGRTGRRLTQQTYHIMPKIKEVDDAMTRADQSRVFEVHPEVCFYAIAGNPMRHNKKRGEGRNERWSVLRTVLPSLPPVPDLPSEMRKVCGVDDYIDASVAAWTAVCILRGDARCIPKSPARDERNLRMEMWLPGEHHEAKR